MRLRKPLPRSRRLPGWTLNAVLAGLTALAGLAALAALAPMSGPLSGPEAVGVRVAHAAPARRAAAPLQARCKVLVIQGRKTPGAFPANLRHLRSRLAAKPFKVFRSFELLGTKTLPLATGRLTRAALVGPYRVEAQLLSRLRARRRKPRLQLQLSLFRKRTRLEGAKRLLRTKLVIDQGGTLFLAGPRYRAGRLILALTCK